MPRGEAGGESPVVDGLARSRVHLLHVAVGAGKSGVTYDARGE